MKQKLADSLTASRMYIAFALGVIAGTAAEQELYWHCGVIILLFWYAEYVLNERNKLDESGKMNTRYKKRE